MMTNEIIVSEILADIDDAAAKQKDMFEIMYRPTAENVTAFYKKYEPEKWATFNLLTVMGAIYKSRFALGIEKEESLKWLKDHNMDLDVLDDIESDLKDQSVPVKKARYWL